MNQAEVLEKYLERIAIALEVPKFIKFFCPICDTSCAGNENIHVMGNGQMYHMTCVAKQGSK